MKKVKSKDYSKKINSAVFISGRGTNFKSLLSFSKKKVSPIRIKLLITDNKNAKGIFFAKKNNVKFKSFSYKTRQRSELKILKELKKNKIKFIMLAGFMKILSKNFINKFDGKIVNIHPSLLPKYGGKGMYGSNVHKAVLKNKELESGITIHFVNQNYDEGEVILQKTCVVSDFETIKSLEEKIRNLEFEYFPKTIKKMVI